MVLTSVLILVSLSDAVLDDSLGISKILGGIARTMVVIRTVMVSVSWAEIF